MFNALASLGIILAFILLRAGEFRLHQQNYDFLLFAGGQEEIPKLMTRYYYLDWGFMLVGFLEFLIFPKFINNHQQIVGLVMLMFFAAVRIWSINVLGKYWSMRCIYVAGFPLVKNGPYRFIKHPEYVSRFGEMLGISLFLGTYVSFGLYVVCVVFLLKKILLHEKRQLQQFADSKAQPVH